MWNMTKFIKYNDGVFYIFCYSLLKFTFYLFLVTFLPLPKVKSDNILTQIVKVCVIFANTIAIFTYIYTFYLKFFN